MGKFNKNKKNTKNTKTKQEEPEEDFIDEPDLDEVEEFANLTEEEVEMTLYKNYIHHDHLSAMDITPATISWYSTPQRRGVVFKLIYFNMYYLRQNEAQKPSKIRLRILDHQAKFGSEFTFFVKDQVFRFNFAVGVSTTLSKNVLQNKRERIRNFLLKDYHKPELDFTKQFMERVNQFNNEAVIDCVYRAVDDVRAGKMEALQLVKISGFEDVFAEDQGSFKGVIRAVNRVGGEEVFVPVELCLSYKKDYKYLALFRPNATHFHELQKLKNEHHPKMMFGLMYTLLDICYSYSDAIDVLKQPIGQNKHSKAALMSLRLNDKLKHCDIDPTKRDQELKEAEKLEKLKKEKAEEDEDRAKNPDKYKNESKREKNKRWDKYEVLRQLSQYTTKAFYSFDYDQKKFTFENYTIFSNPTKFSQSFETGPQIRHSNKNINFWFELRKVNLKHIESCAALAPFLVVPYKERIQEEAEEELKELEDKRWMRLYKEYGRRGFQYPSMTDMIELEKPEEEKKKEATKNNKSQKTNNNQQNNNNQKKNHPKNQKKYFEIKSRAEMGDLARQEKEAKTRMKARHEAFLEARKEPPVPEWTEEERQNERVIKENLEISLNNVDIHSQRFRDKVFDKFLKLKIKFKSWCTYGWNEKFKLYHVATYNSQQRQFDFATDDELFYAPAGNKYDPLYKETDHPDSIPYVCIDLPTDWAELDKSFEVRDFLAEEKAEKERRAAIKREERVRRFREKYGYELEYKENEDEVKRQLKLLEKKKKVKTEKLREKICSNIGKYRMETILRRIPNFDFRFTEDQLKMINSPSKRTIVIGRSGTGKSTCAILRMLAIDLLFIARKVLMEKRYKVEADDLKPTGIRHLFLTASRVLADDLKIFYQSLLEALKKKLLGRQLKKKVEVEKVVETVEMIQEQPQQFVEDLQNVAEDDDDDVVEAAESRPKSGSEKKSEEGEGDQPEKEEMEEGGQNQEKKEEDDQNEDDESEDSDDSEEFKDIAAGDDQTFNFEPTSEKEGDTSTTEEKMENQEVYSLKKTTLEQVEEKLKHYNFRFDTLDQEQVKGDAKYPMFTTLIDFYQKSHTELSVRGFLCSSRFAITEETEKLKKVSFNQYLDSYSNRRFKDFNTSLLKNAKGLGLETGGADNEGMGNYYSRLIDAKNFQDEFYPFLIEVTEYFKQLLKKIPHLKSSLLAENYLACGDPEKQKNSRLAHPSNYGKMTTFYCSDEEMRYYQKMRKPFYDKKNQHRPGNVGFKKERYMVLFKKDFGYFEYFRMTKKNRSPAYLWNVMKNRELDTKIVEGSNYLMKYLLAVLDFWKERNHTYELRDMAVLGGHSKKKVWWSWHYNFDGTRVMKVAHHSMRREENTPGYCARRNHIDFVYLDEIQDVSLPVILDLDLIAKFAFVGFGDNAQNITKGVSMKFSRLVGTLDQVDSVQEDRKISEAAHNRYIHYKQELARFKTKEEEGILTKKEFSVRTKLDNSWKNQYTSIGELNKKKGVWYLRKWVKIEKKSLKTYFQKDEFEWREFEIEEESPCEFIQLRKNFRSHKRILELGNSIVRILEMLQRGDLDIMDDEVSDIDGPRPIILKRGENLKSLMTLLTTAYGCHIKENGRVASSAELVLIVRDQEQKRELPEELQDMVVFTIKESKGLEFQHVILLDFFSTSTQYQCWNYIKSINITTREFTEEEYKELLKKKELSRNGLVDNQRFFTPHHSQETGLYTVPCMMMGNKIKTQDIEMYNHVNDELKALYVAITRAKKTFVICDFGSTSKNRANLDEVWKVLNCVDFVGLSEIKMDLDGRFCVDEKTALQQWLFKGFEYLRREQFTNAKRCFECLGHQTAIDLCDGFLFLESIQKKEYYITMNQNITHDSIEESLKEDYLQAADLFRKAEKYRDAALCYFNGMNYVKAKQFFEKVGMKKEAALMNYIIGHYSRAAQLFYEIGDYYSCLICKEIKGDISDFLEIMVEMFQKEKGLMKERKYVELFNRYAKKYFENLNNEMFMAIAEQEIQEEEERLRKIKEKEEKEASKKAAATKDQKEDSKEENPENDTSEKKPEDSISGIGSFVEIGASLNENDQNSFSDFAEVASATSNLHSFKLMQEMSQNKDSVSESFVNISYNDEGKAMSQGDSAFLDMGIKPGDSKMFIEERILSKMLKFASCFIPLMSTTAKEYYFNEDTFKSKNGPESEQKKKEEEEKNKKAAEENGSDNEFDIDELTDSAVPQKLIDSLISYFIETNIDDLNWMFISRFGSKRNYRRIVFKLAEDYSVIGTSTQRFSYYSFYSHQQFLSRQDQRRLTTLAFSSIFQRIPRKMLRVGKEDDSGALFSIKDIQILVMLGYVRQIMFLLSYEDNKRLLTFLGDIDVLGVLWCKHELKSQQERDQFIGDVMSMDIYDRMALVCRKHYDDDLLEASLFKMFKNSFWNMFEDSKLPKLLEFVRKEEIRSRLELFSETIEMLAEYKEISKIASEEDDEVSEEALKARKAKFDEFGRRVKGLISSAVLKEKIDGLSYMERYELGMTLCIWYCFFYLKAPPNCPFSLNEEEVEYVALFTQKDGENKKIILTGYKKLQRALWMVYERFCLDQHRFIGDKNDTTDPFKKGFWSVFLIREIEPIKTKFFRGLGLHKYYVVNKMSQIAVLTKELKVRDIVFLENSLDIFAINTTIFEARIATYLKPEEFTVEIEGTDGEVNVRGVEWLNQEFVAKRKKWLLGEATKAKMRYKVQHVKRKLKEWVVEEAKLKERIKRMGAGLPSISDDIMDLETDAMHHRIAKLRGELAHKRKENQKLKPDCYDEFTSIMNYCYKSMLDFDTQPKNWYLVELLNDYLSNSKKTFTTDSVLNAFLLAKRTDKMEYFSHYYRKYNKLLKKKPDTVDKALGELFYNLIDSEVSLEAGCSNEFLYGYHSILQKFWKEIDLKLLHYMILRVLAVYNASIKGDSVSRLTEIQIEFLEDLPKGGNLRRNEGTGHEEGKEWLVKGCKLDHLTDVGDLTNLISQLLREIVASERLPNSLSEELTYLHGVQLRTDPDLITQETADLVQEDYKEMARMVFERLNDFVDLNESQDEEAYFEDMDDYIENLNKPLYRSGSHLKYCFMLKFEDSGKSHSEENLKAYQDINRQRLIKRTRQLASLQTLRKYSSWWIKYCKKQFKITIDLNRQASTSLPFTLLSSANFFMNLGPSKSYRMSLVREVQKRITAYFERVNRNSTTMIEEYTQSKMVRNFVYFLDHLLTYLNTVEQDLRVLEERVETFKRLDYKNRVLKATQADAYFFDFLLKKCYKDLYTLKGVFKLKTVDNFHHKKLMSRASERSYKRAFELSAHKQIFRNMARSYVTTKNMIKKVNRKFRSEIRAEGFGAVRKVLKYQEKMEKAKQERQNKKKRNKKSEKKNDKKNEKKKGNKKKGKKK